MNEGRWGERLAGWYLMLHGYRILERNYRVGRYELDIIARAMDGTICFVEVKTRGPHSFGLPREAVGQRKQQYLYRAAQGYLMHTKAPDAPVRMDVVEVYLRPFHIIHIQNALEM